MLPKKSNESQTSSGLLSANKKEYRFQSEKPKSTWQPQVVQGSEHLMELAMMGGDPIVFDTALTDACKLRPDIINFQEENNGCVPLHVASSKGNLPLISLLLRRRASINMQDFFGNTPLLYALDKKHNECAQVTILFSLPTDFDAIVNLLIYFKYFSASHSQWGQHSTC